MRRLVPWLGIWLLTASAAAQTAKVDLSKLPAPATGAATTGGFAGTSTRGFGATTGVGWAFLPAAPVSSFARSSLGVGDGGGGGGCLMSIRTVGSVCWISETVPGLARTSAAMAA